mmetsp:Transcript_36480/g.83222  ORF Transcript_36480/g.83222 Transcript_36480/m.83222 type:complete len:211 (+) Transcript_36480:2647-3279(+)
MQRSILCPMAEVPQTGRRERLPVPTKLSGSFDPCLTPMKAIWELVYLDLGSVKLSPFERRYQQTAETGTRRVFVDKMCSFVPETTRLLRALGPALRTALFSRLNPRTRLNTHTGWSDLANHVLRVHIPLAVPGGDYSAGLCGTWVDGCVETHEAGRIVCFDDSKVHRAYNYTDEERVVLIVDLLRPSTLPPGHAVGGHTDALDEFIRSVG